MFHAQVVADYYDSEAEARVLAPRSAVHVWNPGLDGGPAGAIRGFHPNDWDGTTAYVLAKHWTVFSHYCEGCGRVVKAEVWERPADQQKE